MKTVALLVSLTLFIPFPVCFASLGDGAESLNTEAKTLVAKHTSTKTGLYEVHVLKLASSTVKEYVSSKNVVFAVTWQGEKRPDLSVLLGQHYQEFAAESAKQPKLHGGRQPHTVQTKTLYVHGGGHMRDLRGIAYLPTAVPAGVNVEGLQ